MSISSICSEFRARQSAALVARSRVGKNQDTSSKIREFSRTEATRPDRTRSEIKKEGASGFRSLSRVRTNDWRYLNEIGGRASAAELIRVVSCPLQRTN